MALGTRRVTPALILKGEDSLHCSGGHNPEALSRGFPVTSGISSMSQTSRGMEDQNTFLFHPMSFIRRRNSRMPWSFRKTRAAMYSLGRVPVCLLQMGLLRPGVVLTLSVARSLVPCFIPFQTAQRGLLGFSSFCGQRNQSSQKLDSLHDYCHARKARA